MELALGTAQFGLAYGVAGREAPLRDDEARAVLEAAAHYGVRWLDTAAVYGDIEQRLAGLCTGLPFQAISKLPPCPAEIRPEAAASFFVGALRRSRDRLGERLRVMLFHRADDLAGVHGDVVWSAVHAEAKAAGIELGVSFYDLPTLRDVHSRWRLNAAQLPGNALDQAVGALSKGEAPPLLQLRSAFLQGLLLMREEDAARRLPAAASALRRWHAWCGAQGLERLDAALGIVKGFAAVNQCVIGVDGLKHLEQIIAAWSRSTALRAPELACVEAAVTDPRTWRLSA